MLSFGIPSKLSYSPACHAAHCIVTFVKFEYTINQGVAPTLVYPISTPESSPVFGRIVHSIRDYYPLWQVRPYFVLSSNSRNTPWISLYTKVPCFSLARPSHLGYPLFQHVQFRYPQ